MLGGRPCRSAIILAQQGEIFVGRLLFCSSFVLAVSPLFPGCRGRRLGWYHQEIDLVVTGEVRMTCPPVSLGAPEPPSDASPPPNTIPRPRSSPDSSSRSTRTLVERSVLLKPRGRLDAGMHRLSFTFPLLGIGGEPLLETYRGKFIEVVYTASVRIERGMFSRTLEKKAEFAVRAHPAERPTGDEHKLLKPVPIRITPTSITENAVQHVPPNGFAITSKAGINQPSPVDAGSLPNFHIRGHFDSALWSLDDPITGEVAVLSSAKPVKSVEVRLNRVEGVCQESGGEMPLSPGQSSARAGGGFIISRTEVQTHRIAEGDVPRGVSLPVHFVLPTLLVCPTVASGLAFRIGWELEVQILFFDGTKVTEPYPVVLYRGQ